MAWNIFPTENNVGTINGKATRVIGYEPNFMNWIDAIHRSPKPTFVFSGMTLSSPANNQVRVAAGTAIIDGFYLNSDANVDLSGLANSTTYWIYGTLNRDGNSLASGVTVDKTTSTTLPASSVLFGRAVTNGSGVVTVTNATVTPRSKGGTYTGDGTGSKFVEVGFVVESAVVFSTDAVHISTTTSTHLFGFTVADTAPADDNPNLGGQAYRFIAFA